MASKVKVAFIGAGYMTEFHALKKEIDSIQSRAKRV
jgi:hypothetical protein